MLVEHLVRVTDSETASLQNLLKLVTASPELSIRFEIFYTPIISQFLNMLKMKRDSNQRDFKIVDLYFLF